MQTVQAPPPPKKPKRRRDARQLLSTRGGTTFVAFVSSALAAGLLLIFLNNYRDSVNGDEEKVSVLVAKTLIEDGSPGDVVAEEELFQSTTVKVGELKDGAISDPSNLEGKIATKDVYPGEQLVAGEFAPATPGVVNRLRGTKRAIAVPMDESHGMIGTVRAGDHVDILAGIGLQQAGGDNGKATLRVIARDALVLKVPDKVVQGGVSSGPNSVKPTVLRVTDNVAARIAFAADVGKVWIIARPKVGAKNSRLAETVDLQSLALRAGARVLSEIEEEGP